MAINCPRKSRIQNEQAGSIKHVQCIVMAFKNSVDKSSASHVLKDYLWFCVLDHFCASLGKVHLI